MRKWFVFYRAIFILRLLFFSMTMLNEIRQVISLSIFFKGYTGTVFCIGFLPDEFKFFLEEELGEYKTQDQLQDAVLRHMFGLMTKEKSDILERIVGSALSWDEKLEACVRALLGHVPHSSQYARSLIEAAYARLLQAREYSGLLKPLRSRLVVLRAASSNIPPSSFTYSLQPLIKHQLKSPLAQAFCDLRCASIINKYLDPVLLEEFDKKNLCDTYLLNRDAFMSTGVTTE